ncbi:MAG: hypothetical protein WKF43_03945 [Acidimicrobiales bacterium]
MATFPSRRFVQAGGLTIVHEGLLEYELVELRSRADRRGDPTSTASVAAEPHRFRARGVDLSAIPGSDGALASALALTLLRCTGVISQGPMTSRAIPAGPPIAAPAAQMPGVQKLSYAVHLGHRDPYAVTDDALLELLVARPRGGEIRCEQAEALRVEGAEVSAVLRSADGPLTVRVFNPTDEETTVSLPGRRGWLLDLRGRPVEPFEGSFALRAHGITTAALDE